MNNLSNDGGELCRGTKEGITDTVLGKVDTEISSAKINFHIGVTGRKARRLSREDLAEEVNKISLNVNAVLNLLFNQDNGNHSNAIGYTWFAKMKFVEYLNHVGLGHIPRLTHVECGIIGIHSKWSSGECNHSCEHVGQSNKGHDPMSSTKDDKDEFMRVIEALNTRILDYLEIASKFLPSL
ncbi:hypothetical protein V6N13_012191 [Hibiscus sabdariffa]